MRTMNDIILAALKARNAGNTEEQMAAEKALRERLQNSPLIKAAKAAKAKRDAQKVEE